MLHWTSTNIQVNILDISNLNAGSKYFKITGHICAAYLICGLLQEVKSSINTMQSHLATTLFLVSIETYLRITDSWWTEGRLEDWRDEYFVERLLFITSKINEIRK